jgi:hypothetical protein
MEQRIAIDYSKARPREERLNSPLVQTATATTNYFRKRGTPEILPVDVGSTDANIAISMGIPGVAVGAVVERMAHRWKRMPKPAASCQASSRSSPWQ